MMIITRTHPSRRVGALLAGAVVAASATLLPATSATAAETCLGEPVTIFAEPGQVTYGTARSDVIFGTAGTDDIHGNGGSDVICGRGGDDDITGGNGRDRLYDGDGADRLQGGGDKDSLISMGDSGIIDENVEDTDVLSGGKHDDSLAVWVSASGPKSLSGGDGDDFLISGDTPDKLHGNAGNDEDQGASRARRPAARGRPD